MEITKQKAELALKQRESRLREAQKIAHIGHWELNLETNDLKWSDEIFRIFEINQSKFGASYNAFLETIHPEDREMVNEAYTESVKNRTTYSIDHRLLFKDGRIKFVHEQCETYYDDNGNALRSLGTIQDITAKKLANEQLRKSERNLAVMFENSLDMIQRVNPDDTFLSVNRAWCDTLGYTSEEVKGLTFLDIVHPDHHDNCMQILKTLMEGEGSIPVETEFVTKDGTVLMVEGNVSGLFIDNEFTHTNGFFRDVTERKKAENEILRSLAEKEVLLKEVHHRVKNNMQLITSLIRTQSAEIDDENILNALREIENRVKSMAMIHDRLYRTEELSNIDFGEYAKRLGLHLGQVYSLPAKSIELNVIGTISLGIDDAVPCGLIINELVSNAFKHAFKDRDKGLITIEFDQTGSAISLKVTDDGVGLPEDFNIEELHSLGLDLVSTLVDQLDGSMDVSVDEGTTVTIRFTHE